MSCKVLKTKMKPPKSMFEDLSDFAETSAQWVGRMLPQNEKKFFTQGPFPSQPKGSACIKGKINKS
jgi:hypothetical protein